MALKRTNGKSGVESVEELEARGIDPDLVEGTWEGKYNPADFIVPGQDHQGHSERVWCRVMPLIDRQLELIVKSRKFPYRTKGDLIRHGLMRHLKHLEGMEPVTGFMNQAEAIMGMLRDEIYMQQFLTMFQHLEQVVGQHTSMHAIGEARKLVAGVKAKIVAMDEGHWRKKCLEELKNRFGHLMDGAPVAKLREKKK